MNLRSKSIVILCLAFLSTIILLHGCGNKNDAATPSTSIVQIQPDKYAQTGISADTVTTFKVMVLAPDATPIPFAKVKISGQFAVPRANPHYEFHDTPDGSGPAVDSGFEVHTNGSGYYDFSIVIYATAGAPPVPNTFADTITAFSGPATIGQATVSVQ